MRQTSYVQIFLFSTVCIFMVLHLYHLYYHYVRRRTEGGGARGHAPQTIDKKIKTQVQR